MFHSAVLYTTEFGFFDGDVQADIEELDKVKGIYTDYDALDGNIRRYEIHYPEDPGDYKDACIITDRMLRHLRARKESYDFYRGNSYSEYGAHTEFYRPDQDFSGSTTDEDPHFLIKYAELNTGDMEHSFRKIIKLIDAGEPEEAKAYAERCLYPEVKPIEEYGDPTE